MRKLSFVCLCAAVLLIGGCKDKPKEVPPVVRAEAQTLVTEARLASQLRDHAKAAELLSKAVELDPEVPVYWSLLGMTRVKLGDKSGARKAYKQVVAINERLYKRDAKEPNPLLLQIEPLILMGDVGDARKILERALKAHPNHPDVRAFKEQNVIDRMLEDPAIKAVML
jgi:Flp pilus assembly protein TadD